MRRTLLAAALVCPLAACSPSVTNGKPDDKKPAAKGLKVGDAAPPLADVTWLNGPAAAIEPGKVYVFDFWATWCGPCIAAMPHLAQLQREHAAEGLVVVPVTTVDERNGMPQVKAFVDKRGPKLGVRFAVCDTPATDDAYMKAAGQDGIPCSFVVDKQGKVAFIGHPMELDDVLPKVLAGTWRGAADVAEMKAMNDAFEALIDKAEANPEQCLKDLAAFEAKYPEKAKQAGVRGTKATVLVLAKKYDDAKALTEALIPDLVAKKDSSILKQLGRVWLEPKLNPDKKYASLAVTAAEAVVAIDGDKDPLALIQLADAQFETGDQAKAVATAEKAIAAADDPNLKRYLDQQLKKYKGAEKK